MERSTVTAMVNWIKSAKRLWKRLIASYSNERLKNCWWNSLRIHKAQQSSHSRSKGTVTVADLDEQDWQIRYQRFEQMDDPKLTDLPVLEKALEDEKASIRRLAVVYLGMIEDKKVLPLLYKALKDKSVTVRRTAGDTTIRFRVYRSNGSDD